MTSVVRYDKNASFPAHDHPGGEETLVLDGVFSDEHGDWPSGTYLLNPEGFRHAPFSRQGCDILVKLRQYPGTERQHLAVDTGTPKWHAVSQPGVFIKPLYIQEGFEDRTWLEQWSPIAEPGDRHYPAGAELFVVEGAFSAEAGSYKAGSWLRYPAGSGHSPRTDQGCTPYVKTGGFVYLDSVPEDGTTSSPDHPGYYSMAGTRIAMVLRVPIHVANTSLSTFSLI